VFYAELFVGEHFLKYIGTHPDKANPDKANPDKAGPDKAGLALDSVEKKGAHRRRRDKPALSWERKSLTATT
jgi:hypothetical protein